MFSVFSRRLIFGTAITSLMAVGAYAQGTAYNLRVKRAPIAKALFDFAKQTGISISRPKLSYRDGKTRFMSGKFSIEDGLSQLLRGTDFTFEVIGPRSVRIVRKPKMVVKAIDVAHSVEADFLPIQEILVSSLRRVDMLQQLPYSISAFTSSQQDHLRATTTEDVVHRVASIYVTKQGVGQNKVVIRGLSDGAFAGRAQALVSTYMDNARLTYNAPDPGLKLIDVDRIEVLRGPQGTLYGSGALSGLYRVVSRAPNTVETELSAKASYALTKEGAPVKDVSSIVNAPLVDNQMALRVSAYFEDDGGYIDDERLRLKDVNKSETWGGRAALLTQINDVWRVTVGANYQKYTAEDSNYYDGRRDRLKRGNYIQEPRSDETSQIYVTLEADFGWGELTSSSSWMRRNIDRTFDGTLGVPKLVGLDAVPSPFTEDRDIRTYTNETHLSSTSGDQLEWIVGSFYASRDEHVMSALVVPGASQSEFLAKDQIYSEDLKDDLKEYALFGEVTYYLNEKISLTGGLRWFHYNDKASSNVEDIGLDFVSSVEGAQKRSGVTPKFVVSYHLNDDTLVYGQVSQGYRLGGINLSGPNAIDLNAIAEGLAALPSADFVPTDRALGAFDSDKLTNFELGYKTRVLGGALTVNSAIFYADWSQIQALEYSFFGLPEVDNVGDARVFGAELELFYSPAHNFEIQANLSATDSKITDTTYSFGANVGDPLPGAPNFSAGLSGRYDFELEGEWGASLSADYVYVAGANLLFNKYFTPKTDAYHLSNVRVTVTKGQWQATLFANNLFDSKANSFAFGNPFSLEEPFFIGVPEPLLPLDDSTTSISASAGNTPANQSTPLRPRTIGIELSWRF